MLKGTAVMMMMMVTGRKPKVDHKARAAANLKPAVTREDLQPCLGIC